MSISAQVRESLGRSSYIRKMFEEGDRLRQLYGADKVFDFSIGNPDLEPPIAFQAKLQELAARPIPGMHRYMSNAGYPETRRAVAENINQKSGLELNENQVLMTCGAGGGLNVIFKAILDPGDEVLVNAPYFVEYGFYVGNHQGKLVVAESRPDFQLDLTAIEMAITPRTRALLLNSPNNPTGVIYPEAALRDLAALLARKEREFGSIIYLVSDEPYSSLVYDNAIVPPVLALFEHGIIATSHSKDLALPGERIGYIALNPAIPDCGLLFDALVFTNRILGFVNAPALMQRLVASLQGQSVGTVIYQRRRDLLYGHLTGIGFNVVRPQGAFYLFPQSPVPDDLAFVQAAVKYNLLVVPGSGFGRAGHFRIAYCVSEQVIQNSLPAFTAVAKEFGLG
jgi:aspartate aminotransferase